jgi:hypothetical protein
VLILLLLSCATAFGSAQKNAALVSGDGPVKVEGGMVFKEGELVFKEIAPEKIAPMPEGWAAYHNTAYQIDFAGGVMAGRYVIRFSAASATDRALFESLIILQAVWDKVDGKYLWRDCTIRAPEAAAPDFNAKVISAKSERLGIFVIARPVESRPRDKIVADLSVEIIAPPGAGTGNRELAYDIRVTNRGPQDAAGLMLHGSGFSSDQFVSATPPALGGGRCKQDGSNYDCRLDLLEKGATAVFRLVLVPREDARVPYPETGRPFIVLALVASDAADPNPDNNQARSDMLIFPDPNRAPQVEFTTPAKGEIFVAPAQIKLTAKASDPEGAPAKVEFYDGAKLIGAGKPSGNGQYEIVWRDATPGAHPLAVVVTDSGGRQNYDMTLVRINGTLTARITSPAAGASFNITSEYEGENKIVQGPVKFEAVAYVGSKGRCVKEVFFSLREELPDVARWKQTAKHADTDEATGEARYVATFSDLIPTSYVLTAVATDCEGVETVSSPVSFRINAAPLVKLRPVTPGAPGAPADLTLVAEVLFVSDSSTPGGRGGKVDFYADGKLIGSASLDGFTHTGTFNWRNVTAGSYHVTAVATDSNGLASAPSAPLRITVRNEE